MVPKSPSETKARIAFRPFEASDQDFLFTLYASTRAKEIAGWGWDPAQQEAFLRFQFSAQQRHYALVFPNAERRIVIEDGVPIGGIFVTVAEDDLHLIDFSLMPEARGQGTGTKLLMALKEEAENKKRGVTLSVRKDNLAAMQLYDRLGFQPFGESDTDLQMRWSHAQDH